MAKDVEPQRAGVFTWAFYVRIGAIARVARPWEVIYIVSGPFLFGFGLCMNRLHIPGLLQGFLFTFLVPYVGIGFILLDTIRRRHVTNVAQTMKRVARERETARLMIEAARVAKRDEKEAVERSRTAERDQQAQRDRLSTLGRAKSSATRDEEAARGDERP